jgi:hypothetical protein
MVGGEDVALGCHVNDLSKSAGHLDALRRNGNLRPVPHPHLHGNDGIKETPSAGFLFHPQRKASSPGAPNSVALGQGFASGFGAG